MTVSSFHDLAADFCTAAGAAMPLLTPDPAGVVSFNLQWQGVEIFISHVPADHPDHAFVLALFGQVPQAQQPAVWRELLRANLLLLGPDAPAFSLHPVDDQVILQYTWPLARSSGQGLLAGVQRMAEQALLWRRDFCLDDSAPALPPGIMATMA